VKLRTIAILRGYRPDVAAELAVRCWQAGIDLVEVPVQDDVGWTALEAVGQHADGRPFGAGTVLTASDVQRAVDLNASVIISPGIVEEVVVTSQQLGVLPLPGVMTATDVSLAARLGLQVCKLFPASIVGPAWLEALRGPFPAMRFVAVGGINATNAMDYLSAGASGVALGSGIEDLLALDDPRLVVSAMHSAAERNL
jgi:2-dehydro-3-deoxyphosphogluconate aldolase/(4S)-4-hydroxy-2-oxoglutarate aldolase